MKSPKVLLLALLLVLLGGSIGYSQANAAGTPLTAAITSRTAVSAERGAEIARAHLLANAGNLGLGTDDLAGLRVTNNYADSDTGVRYVYFQQTAHEIGVFNGVLNVTVLANGEVLFVGNRGVANLQKSVNTQTPQITQEQAIANAAAALNLTYRADSVTREETLGGAEQEVRFSGGDLSQSYIPVKLTYQPTGDTLRLAWDLNIYQNDAKHWWSARVDAVTGELLHKNDWVVSENWDSGIVAGTATARVDIRAAGNYASPLAGGDGSSYLVYQIPVESPNHTAPVPPADGRTTVSDPAEASASPFGWHDTNGSAGPEFTTTQGNNAHAYTDTNDDNAPDAGSSPDGGAGLDFTPALDLTLQPTAYRPAAVVNLFYWNNIMHDVPYVHGFHEAAGNFQENNYGEGGLGSDYVFAEAQDGGGTNNANFGTPADGGNPRMQMYVWTSTSPQRDGDLDSGIVAHEYGHGISNRLTGGPANVNCLDNSEQMGEGWSDWQSVSLTFRAGDTATTSRGVGTYALGQPITGPGIRAFPYNTDMSVDPRTYEDTRTAAVPHGVGSIWTAMLWEVRWALIDRYGFNNDMYGDWTTGGNNLSYRLVQDGMKIQPCSPGFEDGRDAIIAADEALTGGENRCLIWESFAKRGLGVSADQGSSGSNADNDEAFDMPNSCLGVEVQAPTVAICAGENAVYNVAVTAPFTQTTSLSGSGNPAPSTLNFNPASGAPPYSSTLTVGNTAAVAAGDYTLTITGTSASYVNASDAGLTVYSGAPTAPTLTLPADGATGVSTAPTFTWAATANTDQYQIQVASDAAFNNIVISDTTSAATYTPSTSLNTETHYYWRVRAENPCADSAYSAVFDFITANLLCFNPNLTIPDGGAASSTFTVSTSQVITDVNIFVDMTHTWVGDVTLSLTHGATTVAFFDRPGVPSSTFGCSGDNLNNTFDDEGTTSMENGCTSNTPAYPASATIIPNATDLLAEFDGLDVNGSWTLNAADGAAGDTGIVNQICFELPSAGPTAVEVGSITADATPTNALPVTAIAVLGMVLLAAAGIVVRRVRG